VLLQKNMWLHKKFLIENFMISQAWLQKLFSCKLHDKTSHLKDWQLAVLSFKYIKKLMIN
jgi:hypothetical protein